MTFTRMTPRLGFPPGPLLGLRSNHVASLFWAIGGPDMCDQEEERDWRTDENDPVLRTVKIFFSEQEDRKIVPKADRSVSWQWKLLFDMLSSRYPGYISETEFRVECFEHQEIKNLIHFLLDHPVKSSVAFFDRDRRSK